MNLLFNQAKRTQKCILFMLCFIPQIIFSHDIHEGHGVLYEWEFKDRTHLSASLLYFRNDSVFLQKDDDQVIAFHLNELCVRDRDYVIQKHLSIIKLNGAQHTSALEQIAGLPAERILYSLILISILSILIYQYYKKDRRKWISIFCTLGLLFILFSFKISDAFRSVTSTNPLTIDSAFSPFKPNVVTSWDNTYFYVQSTGIPTTHNMMVGITSWQQQVPIPQCYTGTNAWSVPLNPVIATTPVPVNPSHFSRGAIAIAANGVPIFNPYTNTGVDAFVDGQLDNWGGHSGRADDYHYHIAPLHLYNFTPSTRPIAYALDGFAVFGAYEPNGQPMQTLDENHGHYWTNGIYHYHGTSAKPYMIGSMVGQVTEDATFQIIPQPSAKPVRPSLTPLRNATITEFAPIGTNGYILTYTLSGQTYKVSYSWTNNGVYTFNFINPTGTVTEQYNGFSQCQLTTAVSNLSAVLNGIKIWPNPTSEYFMLDLKEGILPKDITNISLVSLKGELTCSFDTYKGQIDISNIPRGTYLVLIHTRKNRFAERLIIL